MNKPTYNPRTDAPYFNVNGVDCVQLRRTVLALQQMPKVGAPC